MLTVSIDILTNTVVLLFLASSMNNNEQVEPLLQVDFGSAAIGIATMALIGLAVFMTLAFVIAFVVRCGWDRGEIKPCDQTSDNQ